MMETITLKVTGMTCGGCENAVKRALARLEGVGDVTASHADDAGRRHVRPRPRSRPTRSRPGSPRSATPSSPDGPPMPAGPPVARGPPGALSAGSPACPSSTTCAAIGAVLERIDAVGAHALSGRSAPSTLRRGPARGVRRPAPRRALPEVFALTREVCARVLGLRPVRRADDGRHRAAPGQARAAGHRRGQDARGGPAGRAQRPDRPRRARPHRERLPGRAATRRGWAPAYRVPRALGGGGHPAASTATSAGRPTPPTSRTSRPRKPASTSCATTRSSNPPTSCSARSTTPSSTKRTSS